MGYIGNAPYQGVVDSGNIVDGSIQSGDIANSAITSSKLASGSVTSSAIASDVTTLINQGGGPKITAVQVTNSSWTVLDDTAVDTSGGYIKITGTNFASGCTVIAGTTVASAVTFTSSTELRVQFGSLAAGSYVLYVSNPDGGTAIRVNGITFSATPSWTTSSTLPGSDDGIAISIQLSATSATSYALQSGSTLPAGLTLSSAGLLSGTVSGLTSDTTYNFTVVATDAELQDSPRAFSITISTGDPYWANTTLVLTGDSGDNILRDSSTNNFAITAYGDSRASNFSPYLTGWSNYFDGTGDYLTASSNAAFTLGSTGDFTVECWIYPTAAFSSPGTAPTYILTTHSDYNNAYTNRWGLIGSGSTIIWYNSPGGTGIQSSAMSLLNTWTHIAVVRSGSTITMYINGNSVGTQTAGQDYTTQSGIYVGFTPNSTAFTGYISNARVVKGTALYTANFTPATTTLTAVANTSLLTCHANRLVDSSTNNFAITKNGDVRVNSFNPFNLTNTGTTGSMYFDGSGDYLNVPANAAWNLGSNSFCIECWSYPTTTHADKHLFSLNASDGTGYWVLRYNTGTVPQFIYNNYGTSITSSEAATLNQWNHIAMVSNGTTMSLYLNGTRRATASATAINNGSTNSLIIGSQLTAPREITGYLSSARIVNGSSVYDPTSSTITVPTAPLTAIANTQLLTLQHRQPHNNHSFQDSSANNFLITRSGNTTQGTFSPFSQTGWGNYFDGDGDYFTATANAAYTLGTNDHTIECWFYLDGTQQSSSTIFAYASGSTNTSTNSYFFSVGNTSGNLLLGNGSGGWGVNISFTTPSKNTWHHLAIVRNGNVFTLYIDGVSTGTPATYSANIASQSSFPFEIGGQVTGTGTLGSTAFKGYISNFRVVNGTAVYTSAFTPPTSSLTAITNTVLLTCQSNRFIDNSSNNFTITRNGDTRVVAFSPFNPSASWSAATYGGSGYFDGNGDYLTVSGGLPSGQGTAFTLECWVYVTSLADYRVITRGTVANMFDFGITATGIVTLDNTSTGLICATSAGTITTNQWFHIALTRTTGNIYTIYVNGVSKATSSAYSTSFTANTTIGYSSYSATHNFLGYMSGFKVSSSLVYSTGFSVPTSPPTNDANTSLLLAFTNAGIYDATSKNDLETVGDAKISTTQSKWGGSSMYFDGTGDYLLSPSGQNYAFGTGDFTIEGWFYFSSHANYRVLIDYRTAANQVVPTIYTDVSGYLYYFVNGANRISYTTALPTTTWVHIAIARSGTSTKMFVNGSQAGSTYTDSNTYIVSPLKIGDNYDNTTPFLGYIQDLRITKGVARYTSNFTPPTSQPKLK